MAGPVGMKRVFVTPLDTVDDSAKEVVGTIRREGDAEYIYLKGVASVIVGSVVVLPDDQNYTSAVELVTTTLGAVPRRLGVARAAIVANKFGWFQIRGTCPSIYVAASCAANVALYTIAATAGALDDLATAEHAVHGAWITTTNGGAAAVQPGYLFYPHTVPQLD